jgi:butyryl-CoA dehydrogenase
MHHDDLTPEQAQLRDMARTVATDVFAEQAPAWDRDRTPLPDDERRRLASLDLLGVTLPEAYGGSGLPLYDALLVIEEIAKVAPTAAMPIFEANTGPARVIERFGTEEQKARILPDVVAGEATVAVAISEPDAGSAATDMATRAVVEGDEIVVNGMKRWCTGAGHVEWYLVYVRMGDAPGSRGLGAVLVHRDTPGLSFGPREHLMGFRGIASADMFFDDVRVPRENLVIETGGFKKLFSVFSIERLGNSTMALALGQASLERTATYIRERRQFGREIADFQMVQKSFADMVMKVEAARLLIRRAATKAGTGLPDPLEVSVAKCFTNEMAKEVTDLAMQLHGGYGYSEEYLLERMHRDSHGWALAGGTPNMQRIRIAAEYLGTRVDQRTAA